LFPLISFLKVISIRFSLIASIFFQISPISPQQSLNHSSLPNTRFYAEDLATIGGEDRGNSRYIEKDLRHRIDPTSSADLIQRHVSTVSNIDMDGRNMIPHPQNNVTAKSCGDDS
jgi:hypothetical protein